MVTLLAAVVAPFRALARFMVCVAATVLLVASPALAASYPQPPDPFGFDQRPSVYLERGGEKICVIELRGDLEMGTGPKGSLPDCGQEHAYSCPMPNPSECERREPEDVPELLAWAFGSPADSAVAGAISAPGLASKRAGGGTTGSLASGPGGSGGGIGEPPLVQPPTEPCRWEWECSATPAPETPEEPETPPLAPVPLPSGLPLVLTALLAFRFVRAAR